MWLCPRFVEIFKFTALLFFHRRLAEFVVIFYQCADSACRIAKAGVARDGYAFLATVQDMPDGRFISCQSFEKLKGIEAAFSDRRKREGLRAGKIG